ncbi:hypothetical protein JHW43_001040 [Diplocarpon mali]|nr:hypothetical protein JHW43_001040 [Diplocarpon mali]
MLVLVFLANIFYLVHFSGRAGLVTDFTELQNLFALAVNSPPSTRLDGSRGAEPEGEQLNLDFRVLADGLHFFMKEGREMKNDRACQTKRRNSAQEVPHVKPLASYRKPSNHRDDLHQIIFERFSCSEYHREVRTPPQGSQPRIPCGRRDALSYLFGRQRASHQEQDPESSIITSHSPAPVSVDGSTLSTAEEDSQRRPSAGAFQRGAQKDYALSRLSARRETRCLSQSTELRQG